MKAGRIAVAVSGAGRSLANLLSTQRSHHFEVVGVIAAPATCRGVHVAQAAGLPVFEEPFTTSATTDIDPKLSAWLDALNVDYVALAGFLKWFPALQGRDHTVINIHPALLPKFGGKGMYGERVHTAVLAANERDSGATVHFVNNEYDQGRIIAQTKVPVLPSDDSATLAARVFEAECKLYPAVIDELVTKQLPLEQGFKLYEF